MVDDIERDVEYLIKDTNAKHFSIVLGPYVYAYMIRRFRAYQRMWWRKYHRWIALKESPAFGFLEYKFLDRNGEEIKL